MTEECPHCLKSFKRLKKHLRTCKRKDVPKDSKKYREMDLQDELQERLRKANVNPRQPNSSVKLSVDNIRKIMLKKLNASRDGLRWEAFNSGSYYEILKIDRADEFDLMFTCKIDCDINYYQRSPFYCALKPRQAHRVPLCLVSNDGWLCPKAFRKYFQDKVNEFLRHGGRHELEPNERTMIHRHLKVTYSETCPAVTVEYMSVENKRYTIDLVPAIEFDNFPEPAEEWTCSWIPEENVENIRKTFHVVTKIHETEHVKAPGECRLWRLSFSATEKQLLLRADGKHSPDRNTRRKNVLKLLKMDLFDFYETRRNEPHEFPSYNLKMLMLNLYERHPEIQLWGKVLLLARYIDALRYWKTSIDERQLPHYFIAGENLLQDDGTRRSQLPALEQWVSKCLDKYVIPEAASAELHSNES